MTSLVTQGCLEYTLKLAGNRIHYFGDNCIGKCKLDYNITKGPSWSWSYGSCDQPSHDHGHYSQYKWYEQQICEYSQRVHLFKNMWHETNTVTLIVVIFWLKMKEEASLNVLTVDICVLSIGNGCLILIM